jgi:hypothetical protein
MTDAMQVKEALPTSEEIARTLYDASRSRAGLVPISNERWGDFYDSGLQETLALRWQADAVHNLLLDAVPSPAALDPVATLISNGDGHLLCTRCGRASPHIGCETDIPAALDPVTVEACAKHIEQTYRDEPDEVLRATFIVPEAKSGILQAWHQASDVAAAIRALLSQPDPSGNAPEPVVYISEEGIENTRIFRAQGVVVYPQPVDSCKIPLYRGAPASGNVQEAVSSTKRPDPVVHDERFPSERSVTHTDETKP